MTGPSCPAPRRPLGSNPSQPARRRRVTHRSFSRAGGAVPTDVYTRVTDRLLADLAKGVTPWIRPWHTDPSASPLTRPLRHTGEPYRGINVLLLWSAAIEQGFHSPRWITFRQAQALGGHVRKGEHGSLVVYANRLTKTEQTAEGEDVVRDIGFLKAYTVFNVEQVDGLPDDYAARPPPIFPNAPARLAHAEAFFRHTGATILTRGDRALYSPTCDHILMPPIGTFVDAEAYYATLAHEVVHWTKHPSRQARDFGAARFGDAAYALEEIVAEMGAAFLCDHLEISPVLPERHASYIASWVLALEDDPRAIFKAARFAQQAVDYLTGLQPTAPAPAALLDAPTPEEFG